jgi:prepilin-type N-terminal cleavage/methylation domain-containing protein
MKNSVGKFKSMARQAGFSLIEIVLVLTIIGAATIITISAFNTSDDTNKVHEQITNVNSLSGAVRNMFNTQGNYTSLDNATILKVVSFPEQMKVPGSTSLIKNSWVNDGFDVAPKTITSTDDAFTITMKSVPAKACASISAETFRHFITVTVGSNTITKVAEAAAACTSATNTIVFTTR